MPAQSETVCRVLYIDDTVEDLRMLQHAVSLAGVPVEVMQASSAPQALEYLSNSADFQVLVLDWNLPAVTGLEFLTTLRSTFPKLPVLILTGSPATVDLPAAMGLGAESVIAKPLTLDHWERLAHLLHGFCEDVQGAS
jgi:CheY-like chemotaxis protein